MNLEGRAARNGFVSASGIRIGLVSAGGIRNGFVSADGIRIVDLLAIQVEGRARSAFAVRGMPLASLRNALGARAPNGVRSPARGRKKPRYPQVSGLAISGTPNGNRTRVAALKGRCPGQALLGKMLEKSCTNEASTWATR